MIILENGCTWTFSLGCQLWSKLNVISAHFISSMTWVQLWWKLNLWLSTASTYTRASTEMSPGRVTSVLVRRSEGSCILSCSTFLSVERLSKQHLHYMLLPAATETCSLSTEIRIWHTKQMSTSETVVGHTTSACTDILQKRILWRNWPNYTFSDYYILFNGVITLMSYDWRIGFCY